MLANLLHRPIPGRLHMKLRSIYQLILQSTLALSISNARAQEPFFYCKTFWGGTKITLEKTGDMTGIVRLKSGSANFSAPYTASRVAGQGGSFQTSDKHQFRLSWGYMYEVYPPNIEEKDGYLVSEKRPYPLEYINDRGKKVTGEISCWLKQRISN